MRLNKKKKLIKKIISIFTMTVLIFSLSPLLNSVSAAVLDKTEIINRINQTETNTFFDGLGQCYGFAKETFAKIFNLNADDVSWDYEQGTTTSTYLYLVKKAESESEFTELLNSTEAGDVFCWGGGCGNPHSMIFISKDDEKQQISVLDANWGEYNIIKIHDISYAQLNEFVGGGNIMSLFRYTPEKMSLSSDLVTLYLGTQNELNSAQLTCLVTPEAYLQPVWSSSDNSVAAVDQNGLITAAGEGRTIIICQVGDKTAQCAVTVQAYQPADFGIKYKPLFLPDFKFFQLNGKIFKLMK